MGWQMEYVGCAVTRNSGDVDQASRSRIFPIRASNNRIQPMRCIQPASSHGVGSTRALGRELMSDQSPDSSMEESPMPEDTTSIPFPSELKLSRLSQLWLWGLPLACSLLSIGLLLSFWIERGDVITIEFINGYGIKPEDRLKHKGIDIGTIERIELNRDLSKVLVTVRIQKHAKSIAKEGSRFWIVRPQITSNSIAGLETVLGAKYLAVEPGNLEAPSKTQFIGLENPPTSAPLPGSLELVLDSPSRRGLAPSAPIQFRGYTIGKVIDLGLSSDSRSVQVRCSIDPEFRDLVREGTKFWNRSGWRLEIGLTGVEIEAETIPQMLVGGIEIATPDEAGEMVSTGHRFELHDRPESEWLTWSPSLGFGIGRSELLGRFPPPQRIALRWQVRRFGFRTNEQRLGWCLPLDDQTLLCFQEQVVAPETTLAGTSLIEIAGQSLHEETDYELEMKSSPETNTDKNNSRLVRVRLKNPLPKAIPLWPASRVQFDSMPTSVQNVVIIRDRVQASINIDASRLSVAGNRWLIDESIDLNEDIHGLPVLDIETQNVIGFVGWSSSNCWISLVAADR